MRLGTVIGRVTLSAVVPELIGARWLIVSPFSRDHFQHGLDTPPGMSAEPTLVVYDNQGGIGEISLPGREPLSDVFRELPFPAEALSSPVALLDALRGALASME